MKNYYYSLLIIIVLSLLAGCQAGRVAPGKSRAAKERRGVFVAPGNEFSDTSVVRLPDIRSRGEEKSASTEVEKEFAEAIEKFDAGDYDGSCGKFKMFAETLSRDDSLRQEAAFMIGECDVARGKAASAMSVFESLLAENGIIDSVREKLLVRIGQLYCYMGVEVRAQKFFDKLKTEYPRSIYIQVANCDAIK